MTSEQLYSKLGALKTELKEKYSVEQLAIFGSYAKGKQKPESDIDILVSCVYCLFFNCHMEFNKF